MFHPFRRRRYILNDLKFVVFLVRLKFRTIVLSGLGFGVGACSLTRALPLLLWSLVSGLLLPGCYPTCDMGTRAGPCPTWVLRRIKGTGGMHWTSTKAAHNFPITFISKRAQQLPLSWAPSVAGVGHRHSLTASKVYGYNTYFKKERLLLGRISDSFLSELNSKQEPPNTEGRRESAATTVLWRSFVSPYFHENLETLLKFSSYLIWRHPLQVELAGDACFLPSGRAKRGMFDLSFNCCRLWFLIH